MENHWYARACCQPAGRMQYRVTQRHQLDRIQVVKDRLDAASQAYEKACDMARSGPGEPGRG